MGRLRHAPGLTAVVAPDTLSGPELVMWKAEFGMFPAGHFSPLDVPAMVGHCKLAVEAEQAHRLMIKKARTRDAAGHWRACVALLAASRRALRMVPSARLSPARAGVLAAGRTRADEDARVEGPADWRSLFPSYQEPANTAKKQVIVTTGKNGNDRK